MRIVTHHRKHAHNLFLRLPFVFIHIECSRRPRRLALCSRKLLQSASRSPTTLTVLVKRLEKLRRISEKPSSCAGQLQSCPPLATVTSRAGLRFFCQGPSLTRIRLQNGTRKRNTPSSKFVDAAAAAVEYAHPLHQCTSIEKAISQGVKPVAGNPDHDMTPENVERQVATALL
jgi:hypothetical protein